MKRTLKVILSGIALLAVPSVGFSQAPTLGTAANFALFSSNGAISNTGLSHLTGNVGTNNGSSTAFGNVNGVMHDNDGASVASATDLLTAYNQLDATIPAFFPAPLLGNGQVLNAGVYSISGSATLDGTLTLDAQGNSNAVFVIQIEGSFSSTAASHVVLANNAQACKVYWKVEGLVSLATGTTMKGTIVANNAAIVLGSGVELEGRALSTTGAITVNGVLVYTPIGCGSPVLTGPAAPALNSVACYTLFSSTGRVSNTGVTRVTGDIGTNGGLTTGYDKLNVTGTVHEIADTSTAQAAADLGVVYTSLNTLAHDIELLYPAQLGNNLVLTPHTYLLNAETVLTNNLILDAQNTPNAVFVIKISGALTTSTYAKIILINGAKPENVYWKVTGAVNINDYSEFKGTLVNAGALILNTGTILKGRALTINGSLTTTSINAEMTPGCGTVVPPCTAPVAPTVTAQNFCQSGAVSQLQATGSTGAIFNWYAAATGGTALAGNVVLANGTYYVSQTVNTCESIRVGVTVSITPTPATPTTVATQTRCAGATVADLAATATTGATINWSLTNGGATLSTTTPLISGNYFATQTVGTCSSASVMVAVTVNPIPATPTTTTTQTRCAGATVADLAATATTGATINWSLTNGGATLSTTTPLVSGNYFATQTAGSCSSTAVMVAVTVNPIPATPTTATTQTRCAGATVADLAATAATGATINWSLTNDGATLSTTTPLVSGNYFATQTAGSCSSTAVMVAVTVNPITAAPTGSATQQFTQGQTVASLTISNATNVKWYVMVNSVPVVIPTTTVLVDGETYYATQTLNGCESDYFAVTAKRTLGTASFSAKSLKVYPNPAVSMLTISAEEGIANVLVFNLLGQKVLEQKTTGNVIQMNVERLAAGTYMLQVTSETGKNASLKLLKQ
jgi:hypothetical protein